MNEVLIPLITTLLMAGISAALSMPIWRRLCQWSGLIDSPGHRKIHDQPVTLAGGLAVLTGVLGAAFLWWTLNAIRLDWWFASDLTSDLHRRPTQYAVIAAGLMGMFVLGLLDDRFELRPAAKFLGQLLVAIGTVSGGVRCEIWQGHPVLQFTISILWILAVTNAFNLTDNMNGLCAGLCVIASLGIACIAVRSDELLGATVTVALAGAALGFLPYNYPKASAFLGDSGSHLVGFTLAAMALETTSWREIEGSIVTIIAPALILIVPLADLSWVTCYRTWKRKPFYVGDNNHLSHLLVRLGLPRSVAVAFLWGVATLGGALALFLR